MPDQMIPIPRCDQCKWWESWLNPSIPSALGNCQLFRIRNGEFNKNAKLLADGKNVIVTTHRDFGCVQFDPLGAHGQETKEAK